MSGPLRRRLGELERAVEGIEEAGVAGEERRAYGQRFYSTEQTDARDRERRQGDRELLKRNRASVGQPLRILGRRPRGTFSLLLAEVGTVSGQEASR